MIYHTDSIQNSTVPFTATPPSFQVISFTGRASDGNITFKCAVAENDKTGMAEAESCGNTNKLFSSSELVSFAKTRQARTFYRLKIIQKNGKINYPDIIIINPEKNDD